MTKKSNFISDIFIKIRNLAWLIYFQSVLAALWILLIPGEAEHAVFLGYSSRRLALLLPILALDALVAVAVWLLKRPTRAQLLVTDTTKRSVLARWLVIGGALLAGAMLVLFTFYHYLLWFPDVGAFFRLLPLMVLFFLTGIEAVLFVPLALFRQEKTEDKKISTFWRSRTLWITLAVLLIIFALIELTDIGKEPFRVSIITLGVPLLEGQVWFTVGVIALFLLAVMVWASIPSLKNDKKRRYFDLVIFILIWITAFTFWMQFPLPEHNYFAPAVRPPTFAKIPFSDAEQYDYNSLYVLFGALDGFVVSKPLYVSFLSILHFLVGFDYGRVILLQTAVVALLPAVGYLVGKEFHSRLVGGGLALLLILREANAILAGTMANVSNSKLLMSDVPATLIVAVMVLITIRWCKASKMRVSHHVFLLGGLTAVLNLMRIQTLTLIPFFLVLIFIRYFKRWKLILLAVGIFSLTVGILLSPILVRNHAITGVYWIDNPSSSSGLYDKFTQGSEEEIIVPEVVNKGDLLTRNISVFFSIIRKDFGYVLGYILENFSRNILSTILILPLRLGNKIPFEDMLRMASPFFMEVYSQPGLINLTVLLVNLFVIAVGFASIWRKNALAAAMVVLTYMAYNASSSAVRLSGWRFIQPVDWIMLIFFVAGLVEILDTLIRVVFRRDFSYRLPESAGGNHDRHRFGYDLAAGMAFFVFCAFIPLREGLLPPTYPPYNEDAICAEIGDIVAADEKNFSTDTVVDFCMADTTRVYKGYGFYPRLFKADEGYYDRPYDAYFGRQDYARLVFRLIGGRNARIYIKTTQADVEFQDGVVVYALAYDRSKADAQLVIVGEEQPFVIFSDPIMEGEQTFSELR